MTNTVLMTPAKHEDQITRTYYYTVINEWCQERKIKVDWVNHVSWRISNIFVINTEDAVVLMLRFSWIKEYARD
jgi:hypothetical protein